MIKLFFFTLFYSTSTWAIQGRIEFPESKEIVVGDIFKADLFIEGYDKLDESKFFELEGQLLSDSFYIVAINGVQELGGETKYLRVPMTLVFKKKISGRSEIHLWPQGLNIPISLSQIEIVDQKLKIQEFKKWKQKELPRGFHYLWFLIILIPFLVFFIILITRKKENKMEIEKAKIIQLVKDRIKTANSRESIEEIYQYRYFLEEIYGKKNAGKFLKVLNECQYKPQWTEGDQARVEEKLNKLRIQN